MKKIIVVFFLMISLLPYSNVVLAADPLYRMLHADEVKAFQEDQDALVIAQLKQEQGNKFVAHVIKTITGEVNSEIILVDMFTYTYNHKLPTLNRPLS